MHRVVYMRRRPEPGAPVTTLGSPHERAPQCGGYFSAGRSDLTPSVTSRLAGGAKCGVRGAFDSPCGALPKARARHHTASTCWTRLMCVAYRPETVAASG